MATESKIDGIMQDGVWYEFQDSTARNSITKLTQRLNDNDEHVAMMINEETERALAAEKILDDSKVSIVAGKGLSTNDFTDELKSRVENPPAMIGATTVYNGEAGAVPRPMRDDIDKFLKGDGTWATPTDTTYEVATRYEDGLLSKDDKYKLDTLDTENDDLVSGRTTFEDNVITQVLGNGKTKITTFNDDGSITLRIEKANVDPIVLTTVFNADGSIRRTRS